MNSAENNKHLTPVYLRERVGKTQKELADDLSRTVTTISSWERGFKLPRFESAEEVEAMMRGYECSLEELVEAFGGCNVKLTLAQLKTLLDQGGLTLEDWKRLGGE